MSRPRVRMPARWRVTGGIRVSPDVVVRRFRTIALRTALEGYAMGRSATATKKTKKRRKHRDRARRSAPEKRPPAKNGERLQNDIAGFPLLKIIRNKTSLFSAGAGQ